MGWVQLAAWVLLTVAQYYLRDKPRGPKPGKIEIPTTEEGTPFTVLFGSRWIKGPVVAWWGDTKTKEIKSGGGLFGDSTVVGFRYFIGMHQVYLMAPKSRAAVDSITKIRVGEVDVWTGSITASGPVSINAPKAFGGRKKEGGVIGTVDVAMGEPAQGVNSYLASKLSGFPLPAYRGMLALILRQVEVAVNNPHPKPWSIFASRVSQTWYPAKADIGGNLNPAHIIYEVLTDGAFGLGLAPAALDLASFTAAADTLHAEGLGLSIRWEGVSSADDFIEAVEQQIDGGVTLDINTGLFRLKLARDDYTFGALPILSESNITRVERYAQPMVRDLSSHVVLKYEDRDTGKPGSVSVQDIAVLQMQGGQPVTTTVDYDGIPDAATAAKVAARELRARSTRLGRVTLFCQRTVWGLNKGDVFRWQWPDYNIGDVVMRVAAIDYGELADGEVRIDAIQDIFAAATAIFSPPAATAWVNPATAPAASPQRVVFEAPYWLLARDVVGNFPSLFADLDPTSGMVVAGGSRPSGDAYDYELWDRTGAGAYTNKADGAFCAVAEVVDAVPRSAADVVLNLINTQDLTDVVVDTWAIIGSEIVKVKAVGSTTVTVARGVLDTVPAAHSSGAQIYFVDGSYAIDSDAWAISTTVNVKLLPRTSLGALDEASAPADNVTLAKRFIRPYAPGNVRINSNSYPSSVTGDLTFSWTHRDRLTQLATLVEQGAASIGPEASTTYTVRIYNAQTGGTLIRTYSGLTGVSQLYTVAQAITDNGSQPANIRAEIEAVRDGHTSWQFHTVATAWV